MQLVLMYSKLKHCITASSTHGTLHGSTFVSIKLEYITLTSYIFPCTPDARRALNKIQTSSFLNVLPHVKNKACFI